MDKNQQDPRKKARKTLNTHMVVDSLNEQFTHFLRKWNQCHLTFKSRVLDEHISLDKSTVHVRNYGLNGNKILHIYIMLEMPCFEQLHSFYSSAFEATETGGILEFNDSLEFMPVLKEFFKSLDKDNIFQTVRFEIKHEGDVDAPTSHTLKIYTRLCGEFDKVVVEFRFNSTKSNDIAWNTIFF